MRQPPCDAEARMITDLTQHQTYGSAEASRWCRICQMSCSITAARRDAPTTSHCGRASSRAFSRQRSARNERGGRAGFFSLGEWAVGVLKRWCASQHHRNPLTSSPTAVSQGGEGLRNLGGNLAPDDLKAKPPPFLTTPFQAPFKRAMAVLTPARLPQ